MPFTFPPQHVHSDPAVGLRVWTRTSVIAFVTNRSRALLIAHVYHLLIFRVILSFLLPHLPTLTVHLQTNVFSAVTWTLYPGAVKSLARPGRKQATATKLTFQATQKKFRRLSVQPGLRGSNDLRVGRKMAIFQFFFQSCRAKDLSALLYVAVSLPLTPMWCRGSE